MESGLVGRNNLKYFPGDLLPEFAVSMESGLVGRNNTSTPPRNPGFMVVSMESGLVGRNNSYTLLSAHAKYLVSMESGLVGRNNEDIYVGLVEAEHCLNGVRPSWPEQ